MTPGGPPLVIGSEQGVKPLLNNYPLVAQLEEHPAVYWKVASASLVERVVLKVR